MKESGLRRFVANVDDIVFGGRGVMEKDKINKAIDDLIECTGDEIEAAESSAAKETSILEQAAADDLSGLRGIPERLARESVERQLKRELKLYVWEGDRVLPIDISGLICVLASSLKHALDLVEEKYPTYMKSFPANHYRVIEYPEAFAVWE